MKSFIKNYYLVGIILVLLGLSSAFYLYNKPHLDLKNEKPDIEISSDELFKQFSLDETTSNTLYLNKIIQVKGKLAEVSENEQGNKILVLTTQSAMGSVRCTLSKEQSDFSKDMIKNMSIEVKGLCTGMLMDVILVDCILTYP